MVATDYVHRVEKLPYGSFTLVVECLSSIFAWTKSVHIGNVDNEALGILTNPAPGWRSTIQWLLPSKPQYVYIDAFSI